MRKPKIHFKNSLTLLSLCGNSSHKRGGGPPPLTSNLSEVTCKNCLKMAVNKTTEQGSGAHFEVMVVKTGPMFINFIKAVRELLRDVPGIPVENFSDILNRSGNGNFFGLKQSKDFADSVRGTGQVQSLVKGVTHSQAGQIRKILESVGAEVEVTCPGDTPRFGLSIEQAYREMLAQFMPNYADNQARLERLESHDDNMEWPTCWYSTPKVSDLKRWVAAGEQQ